MRTKTLIPLVVFLLAACGGRAEPPAQTSQTPVAEAPAEAPARSRLDASPRHAERVEVRHGDRTVSAFLVFPEVAGPAPAVVVIHENRGLVTWAREVADRLAEAGYVVIAPDLLSGTGPGGGGTASYADPDAARDGIYALPPEQVTADLAAVADHVSKLPACNGKLAVVGFCWGGSQSFRFATNRADLKLACVFYGTAPETETELARIACPVYGFYGGDDARVNATLKATAAAMTAAGKTFEPVVYEGAGHAFMRRGEEPDASSANREAHDRAWERLLEVLGRTF